MARKKLRWEHWLIIALVLALAAAWALWPKPTVDEKVKVFQRVIDEQDIIIDSLKNELRQTQSGLNDLMKARQAERHKAEREVTRLTNQRQDNETINQLPTPQLDSIVRRFYGAGAI